MKDGRGVLNSFRFSFFLSFIGDYVFQRDLHAATRLDHQASEKQKAEIRQRDRE